MAYNKRLPVFQALATNDKDTALETHKPFVEGKEDGAIVVEGGPVQETPAAGAAGRSWARVVLAPAPKRPEPVVDLSTETWLVLIEDLVRVRHIKDGEKKIQAKYGDKWLDVMESDIGDKNRERKTILHRDPSDPSERPVQYSNGRRCELSEDDRTRVNRL